MSDLCHHLPSCRASPPLYHYQTVLLDEVHVCEQLAQGWLLRQAYNISCYAIQIICQSITHTHTRLTALCPGLPRWAGTRKVKPIWILLEQETVSGSGISWAICKSAPHSRQITTPALHYSFFTGQMPFLPPNQQCQSTEGKCQSINESTFIHQALPYPSSLYESLPQYIYGNFQKFPPPILNFWKLCNATASDETCSSESLFHALFYLHHTNDAGMLLVVLLTVALGSRPCSYADDAGTTLLVVLLTVAL